MWYQKELFTLNIFPKNKNKPRQKKDEIKKEVIQIIQPKQNIKINKTIQLFILFTELTFPAFLTLQETITNITVHILNYNSSFLLDITNKQF